MTYGLAATVLCGLTVFWVVDWCYQQRPFYRAIRRGDRNTVEMSLSADVGATKERSPMLGITPLHVACDCESGNVGIVTLLLQKGADPNAQRESKLTPLQLASFHGNADIVELLIAHGANVNHRGWRHNDTALQVAALHDHLDVVRLLLKHGADRNYRDMVNKTALDLAKERGHTNVVALLSRTEVQTTDN